MPILSNLSLYAFSVSFNLRSLILRIIDLNFFVRPSNFITLSFFAIFPSPMLFTGASSFISSAIDSSSSMYNASLFVNLSIVSVSSRSNLPDSIICSTNTLYSFSSICSFSRNNAAAYVPILDLTKGILCNILLKLKTKR